MYQRCFCVGCFDKNAILWLRLCLVWLAGLSLGFIAVRFYGDSLEAYIQKAPAVAPDFIGCLAINALPLLISACAVFFFQAIVYPLCCLRGFITGLGLGSIAISYCGAAYMMAGLLQFSMILFTPFLLWFFHRRLELGERYLRRDYGLCFGIGLIIACTDVWMVSPFLLEVINF